MAFFLLADLKGIKHVFKIVEINKSRQTKVVLYIYNLKIKTISSIIRPGLK